MFDITKISGNVVTRSMYDKIWLLYGPPGTWKTTTATADVDVTLLAAYEIGYKFIPGIKAINLTNWSGLKELIRQLDKPESREMYKVIAIDTIGLAYKSCIASICARKGVQEIGEIPYGQGYSLAKNEFEKTISMIPQMGYGLIMIAHSDELNDEKNGISVKVDIDKRPSSVIKGMADFILYARKEPKDGAENGEMAVYAYSESSNPNVEVKSRARFFPKRILFTHESILSALDQAITDQDEYYHTKSTSEANFDVYKERETDIKELQEEITILARELLNTNLAERVSHIIQRELKGVRVSETNKVHIPALHAIRDELVELKKDL